MTKDWQIKSVSFCCIGKRANNEDAYFPNSHNSNERNLFLVCDGVGGQNKGEIASVLVCNSFASYLEKNQDLSDIDWVKNAIKFTENNFDNYQDKNPDTKGMASTLTLVAFRKQDVLIAHCGDSRVYHFRDKEILFQTKDHSYINWLIKRGELSLDDANAHPKKNVITRCIEGTKTPTKADIKILNNLISGDFLLLCTDGVLEVWSDNELANLMLSSNEIEFIANSLKLKCDSLSQDNFTAILIKILKTT